MSEEANSDRKKGGHETLMGLFVPPSSKGAAVPMANGQNGGGQQEPNASSNLEETPSPAAVAAASNVESLVLSKSVPFDTNEALKDDSETAQQGNLMNLFTPPPTKTDETTPLMDDASRRNNVMGSRSSGDTAELLSVRDVPIEEPFAKPPRPAEGDTKKWHSACVSQLLQPTTYIGAYMFLLYHIVFSLTMGAAITRPHGGSPMFGIMTKMSASGVMFASIVYWWTLADDVPALYPAVDLFCAPFLADLAAIVDDVLYNDDNVSPQDNDAMFLATFCFLTCVGLAITATLLMLASVFKLANLGAFLPSPVLSGFFAAVGVLLWTLAVKVDTNGMSVGQVIFSGDWNVIRYALIHHVPSLVAACVMKYLSPKSPFYVVGCIVGMISLVYMYMAIAHLGLEDMVKEGWFWSKDDLINTKMDSSHVGFATWAPPAPAGWINSWAQGKVHWGAVHAGMSTAVALAFLYMIRCSLHGAALRKNIALMERLVPVDKSKTDDVEETIVATLRRGTVPRPVRFQQRQVSEAVDVTAFSVYQAACSEASTNGERETNCVAVKSEPTKHTLTEIVAQYAYSQYFCAFVGGFAMTPSIGPSSTLYSLGAEALAPQVGSVILLSIFFFTNFHLVVYIPKPAFSSVLCLAAIDIMDGWFIKSFQKTRSKIEWLVNPFILVAAFSVGLLNAVFLGLALSTFFFVGSFYRSGVVKYVANGITMRSTIERPVNMAQWLDQHGDLMQILVMQSFLFFGNATSVLNYISSMFEEVDEDEDEVGLPPIPKIIVLDLSLVPGIDGSAVDVMSDLVSVCSNYDCKVFLSGMSPSIRKTLSLGGVKPDTSTRDRSQRKLRFFPDLDSAVGKAEDTLIKVSYCPSNSFDHYGPHVAKGTGFQRCLYLIDKQHQTSFENELASLGPYTRPVSLNAGEVLYEDRIFEERGLFFIEEGTLRIEKSTDATRSLTHSGTGSGRTFNQFDSIGHLKARSGSVARRIAKFKNQKAYGTQTFRLARIGPGWVIGNHEALSGMTMAGTIIAVDRCQLHYISYNKLEEVEKKDPILILQLYKLLSKLEALRLEVSVGQFTTLHNIMSAPSHNQPLTTRGRLARQDS